MQVHIEHTDTFAGEANYSWVIRKSFDSEDQTKASQIIRKAKSLLGISGIRHKKEDFGDTIILDYPGICARTFITFQFDDEPMQSAYSYNR